MINTEHKRIIAELKRILRQKKMTYSMLSRKADIPESTIKKLFAGHDTSLGRLMQICEAIEVSFIELAGVLAATKEQEYFSFTTDQDEFFAENIEYYLFFHKLYRDNKTIAVATTELGLSNQKMWKVIRKLEDFGLIEVGEQFKVRFLVKGAVNFPKDGKLQDKILNDVTAAFTQYLVHGEGDDSPVETPFLRLNFAKLTVDNYNKYLSEIRTLIDKYSSIAIQDRKYHSEEELLNVTWLLGLGHINALDLIYSS
jgi:DNA-binding Xre family transcriptional regulator